MSEAFTLKTTRGTERTQRKRSSFTDDDRLLLSIPSGPLNDPDSNREGFSYILTKEGMNRASADIGIMFIAYNIRRAISILGKGRLEKYLRILVSLFLTISTLLRRKISLFEIVMIRFIKGMIPWEQKNLTCDS